MRTLWRWATASNSSCNPCSPTSAKPEGIITAPANLFSPHFLHRAGTKFRRDREHRNVDFLRHVEHARIRLAPEDFIGLRMNRINLAGVAAVDEILHHRVADLAVLRRRADHRDRARIHDPLHGAQDVGLTKSLALRQRLADDDAHVHRRARPLSVAKIGFKSTSRISGKSLTSCETFCKMSASARDRRL